jgi:hypothetical protein
VGVTADKRLRIFEVTAVADSALGHFVAAHIERGCG